MGQVLLLRTDLGFGGCEGCLLVSMESHVELEVGFDWYSQLTPGVGCWLLYSQPKCRGF